MRSVFKVNRLAAMCSIKPALKQVGNSPTVSRSLHPLLHTSNVAGGLQSPVGV